MKRLIAFLVVCLMPVGISWADVPKDYVWNSSTFILVTLVPPALLYVTDSQGRKAGGNPSIRIGQFGNQGHSLDGLKEIPLSATEQQNIANDDSPNHEPQPQTSWFIRIYDSGKQTYTLNLLGLKSGKASVVMYGRLKNNQVIKKITFDFLIEPQKTYKANVTFDPGQQKISTQRIVGKGGLLDDVKSACNLNLINNSVCKRLTKKANKIQDAIEDHKWDKAEGLLKSFLANLGDLKGHGDDDDDYRSSIKEPALTILKEDAKSLLKTVEGHEHSHN